MFAGMLGSYVLTLSKLASIMLLVVVFYSIDVRHVHLSVKSY